MNTFQQLLIIIVGLFLMNFVFSKKLKNTEIIAEDNQTQTSQALDLLPIPATILVSQNPNVIQTKSVELI